MANLYFGKKLNESYFFNLLPSIQLFIIKLETSRLVKTMIYRQT